MSARAAHERRPASPEKSLQRASWERLGSLSGLLGCSRERLGATWRCLGVLLGLLRPLQGVLGAFGASWRRLGSLLGPLDYQDAPKEPRQRAKNGPRGSQKPSFSTTPWEWTTELKSVTLFFRSTPWESCAILSKRLLGAEGISKRPSQGFDTFSLSQGVFFINLS